MRAGVMWLVCLGAGLWGLASRAAEPSQRPNFLIIMADDCTYNDLPVYGGKNAFTPNIDRLAREGLVFDRAYLSMAMCQPCRAELYTGLYPMRNGCCWNHSASRPGIRSLAHYLSALGYRTGLAGKVHVEPKTVFPFEDVPGFCPNCTADPTPPHNVQGIREFMTRKNDQPFCLIVALVEPHVPWVMGDRSRYPVRNLKLPPHIADTPKTREDFAAYLAEITYMDGQVGDILRVLDEAGLRDSTLVLFTSEQGAQFPGCKWTNWNLGVHTALIARWPGHVPAGRRTAALVQYADVAPTLIELAGGNPADFGPLDGTSFREVLLGLKDEHRRYAYFAHNNFPEGPPYPIRSVTDGEWHYIRNLTPQEVYIEKHVMGQLGGATPHNKYWPTWMAHSWNNPTIYGLVKRYMVRPAEELYRLSEDPYEMTNLADRAEFAEVKARLAKELDRWLAEQKDPGVPLDTPEAHKAMKEGQPIF
jgi:uncharacterized sulfatase